MIVHAVETLLDLARMEHWDTQFMKHFFRAASYGKKYDENNEFDHNEYLNCRRHMSVITRLHRSDTCDRQITYK
jgi:hypothetical protein